MASKFVNIEALNLRSDPVVDPTNRLGILHLGQQLTVLDGSTDTEWMKVKAKIKEKDIIGYVKQNINGVFSHREPVSAPRETLVSNAIAQWLRFDQGQGMEYNKPYSGYVGEMWKSIKLSLDGNDRDMPWSAAFISFVIRKSVAVENKYKNFKFASSHSRYLHDSIIRRQSDDVSVPFWGYRLNEQIPQIGDVVARWRETERNYNDASHDDSFKSHCDIIVSVNADFVLAIGGNVGQSVSITRYEKTGAGYLSHSGQAFMLMVNNL
ncbi:DUF2272 domain-containing protein [Pseudomonas moraviensis]